MEMICDSCFEVVEVKVVDNYPTMIDLILNGFTCDACRPKTSNVIPMEYVCRDCSQTSLCTECDWFGKLLDQEVTLADICENREGV